MPTTPKMEKEILEVLGNFDEVKGEAADTRRTRIVKAASRLKDKEWAKLATATQDFVNDAADLIMKKKGCPLFPGEEAPKDDKSEKADAKDTGKDKDAKGDDAPKESAKKGGKSSGEKGGGKKKEPAEKKPKAPKEPRKREGALMEYRRCRLLHQDWDNDKVVAHLKEKGHTYAPATLSTIRGWTDAFLEIMNELGFERVSKK